MDGCCAIVCPDDLDTWEGTHVARHDCLAHALASHGLEDSFRCCHPDLRGFAYYGQSGAASRLDAKVHIEITVLGPSIAQ